MLSIPKKINFKNSYASVVACSAALEITKFSFKVERVLLVIVKDNQTALQLQQEIQFFSGDSVSPLIFPDWETLPYDSFSPHQDIISARIETLHKFQQLKSGIVLIPVSTLMQKLAPRNFIRKHSLLLNAGQALDQTAFVKQLVDAGYHNVSQVYEHGEFAVRGSIIDLFPSGTSKPFRLDFFDNELESLREFDAETQRTLQTLEQIHLLPAHEFAMDSSSIEHFRSQWRSEFDVSMDPACVYQQVSEGRVTPGIEYYLPLFHTQLESLFDYLPENAVVIEIDDLQQTLNSNWKEIQSRYLQRSESILRPPIKAERLYYSPENLNSQLKQYSRIQLFHGLKRNREEILHLEYKAQPDVSLDHRNPQILHRLQQHLKQRPNKCLITAESAGKREQIAEWLVNANISYEVADNWQQFLQAESKVQLCIAPLDQGVSHQQLWQIITEAQLFGEQVRQRKSIKRDKREPDSIIKNLAELQIGAPVVHIEQGIGRYLGLQKLDLNNIEAEFLTLEFAGGDKIYVPVQNLDQISRYSGNADAKVVLSRLGSDQWSKARRKAAEKIRDVAAELLEVHAQRSARQGCSMKVAETEYRLFSSSFPFEETDDQQRTIKAVIKDLAKPNPMDRLVCGDVGFGKTEVAMRAAFIVASCAKQISILVPTTLLAQQHFENFRDRFAEWPFRIEVLSRFVSPKKQKLILQDLAEGKVDIVIGTHKLLQKDIKFKDLGLVIIDEEHRFGVRQKEKLKAMKADVDILALTATPIPRTLNMALSGLRDLSIIATPPQKRLSVNTFVRPSDNLLIKDAISREVRRGGQVYFVHNDVKTIETKAAELEELVPEVRITVAHGQMKERQLEKVMQDFYHHRYQILICTTIIETGIDIPNTNTIIINRADHFGLAQLHQLRGRVGRSHHQAYAYLLTPDSKKMMTRDSIARLEAIETMDELGSGFLLASQDLEIRGSGEILGEDQSGQIQSIGFNLYMEMLDKAVESLKKGEEPSLAAVFADKADIELQIPALLPDEYVADVATRLTLYKRIASAGNSAELDQLKVEFIDRFGLLPEPCKNLFAISRLRQRCNAIGIKKIQASTTSGLVEFSQNTSVEPMHVINMVQTRSDIYKMQGPNKLRFERELGTSEQRLSFVQQLLHRLETGEDKSGI